MKRNPFIPKETTPWALWFFITTDPHFRHLSIIRLPYYTFLLKIIELGGKLHNDRQNPRIKLPKNFKLPTEEFKRPFFKFIDRNRYQDLVNRLPNEMFYRFD